MDDFDFDVYTVSNNWVILKGETMSGKRLAFFAKNVDVCVAKLDNWMKAQAISAIMSQGLQIKPESIGERH
tara:strand:- start:115 stop:327 length:213 start_codon:yes stop_codon:yes gene_type:complete